MQIGQFQRTALRSTNKQRKMKFACVPLIITIHSTFNLSFALGMAIRIIKDENGDIVLWI